jgi:hypothetical protein
MSSASCPDCGCQFLRAKENKTSQANAFCDLCGWEGRINFEFREELTEEGYARCDHKLQLKEEGKLFFIRFFPADPKEFEDGMDEIMRILGINSYKNSESGYSHVQQSQRPTEELLVKLRSVKGIAKVTVF